jgi:hypothetical protein
MIIEAVAAVTAACKALEMAAGAASNIESLGAYIGRLGESEFDLQRAKNSKNLSESESMKIVMAEEQLRQSRAAIRQVFEATHRLDLWNEIQAKTAEARKNRQKEVKRLEALRRKKRKQIIQILIVAALCLGLVPLAIGLVLWWVKG